MHTHLSSRSAARNSSARFEQLSQRHHGLLAVTCLRPLSYGKKSASLLISPLPLLPGRTTHAVTPTDFVSRHRGSGRAHDWTIGTALRRDGGVDERRQGSKTYEVTHTDEEWRKLLSPEAYDVLRHEGTERPFTSKLLDEHHAGTFPAPAATCRCIRRRPNTKAAPAGRVFGRHSTTPSRKSRTRPTAWRAPRCRAAAAAVISAMSSMTTKADLPALLHERRRAEVRAGGRRIGLIRAPRRARS